MNRVMCDACCRCVNDVIVIHGSFFFLARDLFFECG